MSGELGDSREGGTEQGVPGWEEHKAQWCWEN